MARTLGPPAGDRGGARWAEASRARAAEAAPARRAAAGWAPPPGTPPRASYAAGAALTGVLSDGRAPTREALGGYPDVPAEEHRIKLCYYDALKRACVPFGTAEHLYGAEPAEPPPTSDGNGRGGPWDRTGFPDARAFYGWLKDNNSLAPAEDIGDRNDFPVEILHWSPEQIDLATVAILERTAR